MPIELAIGISLIAIVLLLRSNRSNVKIKLLKKQIKILEESHQIIDASNKTIYTITTQNDRIIEAIENNTATLERSINKTGTTQK